MIRGVLLDVDGTLVLSNDAQARAWVEAFKEYGYDVAYERVRPLMGKGGDKLVPEVVPGLSGTEGVGKDIADRRKELVLTRYLPTLQPAPGARELVRRLQDAGLKVVVASSAKADELEALLKVARVDDLLTDRTTSDDAGESKPAPDIVAVALQHIDLSPDEVLMIGDTPYDEESAGKIDVGTIVFRCGGFSDEELQGARAIYDDPADLVAHFEASPLFP